MGIAALKRILRITVTLPILAYQKLISPGLPGSCIYSPTCSTYAREAIMRHGILKGLLLGITRLFRCAGGLYTGGDDPVPDRFSFRHIGRQYRLFWRKRRA
ncbi:MAG TPA: membrane protein insertion efficiency factor YidD [Spirochaetia bacterium]|nr:membrane protein insertion efficiency factor YidD [Spirochaetia bacterium]